MYKGAIKRAWNRNQYFALLMHDIPIIKRDLTKFARTDKEYLWYCDMELRKSEIAFEKAVYGRIVNK